jgi:hypothetical protein
MRAVTSRAALLLHGAMQELAVLNGLRNIRGVPDPLACSFAMTTQAEFLLFRDQQFFIGGGMG